MKNRQGIVHILFHPVSAKRFVEPLVEALLRDGQKAEIWVQPVRGAESFLSSFKVPIRQCPSNLSINPIASLINLIMLFAGLRERRPLVIHTHLFRGAFLPLLAGFFCGVPVRIYQNHGVSYTGYHGVLRQLLMLVERANCALATQVVTVNRSLIPDLRSVTDKEITVFGPGSVCGIDPADYADEQDPHKHKTEARNTLGLGKDSLILLYIGRPYAHKGFPLMVEAFAQKFANRSDVTLLICGCSMEDVIRVHQNPPSNIRALGYLQDLKPIYQASDVVVLPSLYEGLAYSLLEGAAQGCALLASRIPASEPLVVDGKNGILVAPGDKDDLIRALSRMDQDRLSVKAMGMAARLKASEFSRPQIVAPYIAYMRKAMASI